MQFSWQHFGTRIFDIFKAVSEIIRRKKTYVMYNVNHRYGPLYDQTISVESVTIYSHNAIMVYGLNINLLQNKTMVFRYIRIQIYMRVCLMDLSIGAHCMSKLMTFRDNRDVYNICFVTQVPN